MYIIIIISAQASFNVNCSPPTPHPPPHSSYMGLTCRAWPEPVRQMVASGGKGFGWGWFWPPLNKLKIEFSSQITVCTVIYLSFRQAFLLSFRHILHLPGPRLQTSAWIILLSCPNSQAITKAWRLQDYSYCTFANFSMIRSWIFYM